MTIIAWHGDRELRDRIVQRMREHRKADSFIRGEYQLIDESYPLGYRGCAIGCLLEPGADPEGDPCERWWIQVEDQFGIHRDVAEAIDSIFESYRYSDDASDFAVDVIEAIPVGADLTEVAEWIGEESIGDYEQADDLLERLRLAPVAGESSD